MSAMAMVPTALSMCFGISVSTSYSVGIGRRGRWHAICSSISCIALSYPDLVFKFSNNFLSKSVLINVTFLTEYVPFTSKKLDVPISVGLANYYCWPESVALTFSRITSPTLKTMRIDTLFRFFCVWHFYQILRWILAISNYWNRLFCRFWTRLCIKYV